MSDSSVQGLWNELPIASAKNVKVRLLHQAPNVVELEKGGAELTQ